MSKQFRTIFHDCDAEEGGYKPVFGRMVTDNSFTLYLGIFSVRFRIWGDLPKRVFFHYHPFYFEKCEF